MPTFNQLSSRLTLYADGLAKRGLTAKQEVAKTLHNDLINVTPVDTGRARRNWLVANGSSASTTLPEALFRGRGRAGNGTAASPEPTLIEGRRIINQATVEVPIFIDNNVPYIGDLNNGKSLQQPALFVQAAVLRSVNSLRSKLSVLFSYR